tara:strand:- start:2745 stop:3116 length:372 start_codon:yes stop_codon:yes gene_type:complete
MIKELADIANLLDKKGLVKEADIIDELIKKAEGHEKDLKNPEIEKLKETDIMLPVGKKIILQAENNKHNRGLVVELMSDHSYVAYYWYDDPEKIYPVEVFLDGDSRDKSVKKVKFGYHPELDG